MPGDQSGQFYTSDLTTSVLSFSHYADIKRSNITSCNRIRKWGHTLQHIDGVDTKLCKQGNLTG